jgi:hypothetical protein
LGSSTEISVWQLLQNEFNLIVLVVIVESLLDQRGKLSNLSGSFLQQISSLGGSDSNFSGHLGNSNLNAGISFLWKWSAQELV